MNELQVFNSEEFGSIRTIEENGKVLFCGSDVAKALGYQNPSRDIQRHCKAIQERCTTDLVGRQQNMLFIAEGDIYRLAARSTLPGAEKFESWIFDEVLPSIRKTGGYMMPQDYPAALRALADAEEAKMKLLAENQRQAQAIADFEPIRQYVDTILESTGAMATSQIAADYGMSARALNKILHEEGIQHNVNGQWLLYKRHMGKGYTKSKTIQFTHSNGRQDTTLQTRWTQKGRMLIHEVLTGRGIEAVMDRRTSAKEGRLNG